MRGGDEETVNRANVTSNKKLSEKHGLCHSDYDYILEDLFN